MVVFWLSGGVLVCWVGSDVGGVLVRGGGVLGGWWGGLCADEGWDGVWVMCW